MPSDVEAFEFGDIVLIPFPFTNQIASKQRPAVVVSGRRYNLARPDLVMMAVTSQLRPVEGLGEAWVRNWEEAGLLKPSAVKPIMATLEQGLVIRKLGALSSADLASLKRAIAEIIG